MAETTPFRQLPWSEADPLLRQDQRASRREAMAEIGRVRATPNAVGSALLCTAPFVLDLVAMVRIGAGVACAAVRVAGAFVVVLVSEVWPAGWIDASLEHRKLAAERGREADWVIDTTASNKATRIPCGRRAISDLNGRPST